MSFTAVYHTGSTLEYEYQSMNINMSKQRCFRLLSLVINSLTSSGRQFRFKTHGDPFDTDLTK